MDCRPLAGLVILFAPSVLWCAGDRYVGAKACVGCHRRIYERYMSVSMAHSMSPATLAAPLGQEPVKVFSVRLNRSFQVFRKDADIYQSESEADGNGKIVFTTAHKLEFAVGSGVNGYTYIIRRGDSLFEAPLSYYSRTKTWELSPGYEFVDHGFNRPVAAACLACHSGRPRPIRDWWSVSRPAISGVGDRV